MSLLNHRLFKNRYFMNVVHLRLFSNIVNDENADDDDDDYHYDYHDDDDDD